MRSAASALAAVAVCWFFGGWHFAAIAGLAMALRQWESPLLSSAGSLCWLAMFAVSGDPRLFFPFSIQFALQTAFPRSVGVIAAFLLIRISQGATLRVLLVELAVATMVVAISSGAYARSSKSLQARAGWAAFGSILAYLGLAL